MTRHDGKRHVMAPGGHLMAENDISSGRVLCYLAVRKLGYKCSDVAKPVGISAATVSIAISLGSKLSEIGKIQKKILETKALTKLLNEENLQNMKI